MGRTPTSPTAKTKLDFWSNRTSTDSTKSDPWPDNALASGSRLSDDIILNNVIGFDVKAWDPTANGGRGGYVDLGYNNGTFGPSTANSLSHVGDPKSKLNGTATTSRVYDTWSTTYFGTLWNDGIDKDASGNSNGIVDDDSEKDKTPPYPIPLRGIQVKIRTFEPDSKQIREVTVEQSFLPQ